MSLWLRLRLLRSSRCLWIELVIVLVRQAGLGTEGRRDCLGFDGRLFFSFGLVDSVMLSGSLRRETRPTVGHFHGPAPKYFRYSPSRASDGTASHSAWPSFLAHADSSRLTHELRCPPLRP
jgi:hypothetical protein